ncbi:hypothetical protein ACFQO4_19490 [Saliphagus sp. GCM10025334]|uniref:hypothetical protein n=1 Tax=Natronosalvus caseinilyticus TaxID=2953747 RepID=UPI0028A7764C|nr:hypothetical protein [Natronosalvus caseinilyticus]
MALKDVLPDRPLTFDEFQDLQSQNAFDSVMTLDTPSVHNEYLILEKDDTEYVLHHTDEKGWHRCEGSEE